MLNILQTKILENKVDDYIKIDNQILLISII